MLPCCLVAIEARWRWPSWLWTAHSYHEQLNGWARSPLHDFLSDRRKFILSRISVRISWKLTRWHFPLKWLIRCWKLLSRIKRKPRAIISTLGTCIWDPEPWDLALEINPGLLVATQSAYASLLKHILAYLDLISPTRRKSSLCSGQCTRWNPVWMIFAAQFRQGKWVTQTSQLSKSRLANKIAFSSAWSVLRYFISRSSVSALSDTPCG